MPLRFTSGLVLSRTSSASGVPLPLQSSAMQSASRKMCSCMNDCGIAWKRRSVLAFAPLRVWLQ